MSIAFVRRLEELERRVEALERDRAQAGHRRMAGLRDQAAARRAHGDELRAEVRAILAAHPGPRKLKALAVMTYLSRPASLRRVQEVIREVKRETVVASALSASQDQSP
jgi:hypothetical protein